MKTRILHFFQSACLMALLLATFGADATTTTWTGATNNYFNTGTNWSSGLPTAANPGVINTGSPILSGSITVLGNITVTGGSLNVGTYQLTGATGKTLTVSGTGILLVGGASNFPNTFTFALTSGTVEYNGTVAQTVSAQSYGNLTMTNGGTAAQKTLAAAVTITGNLLINPTAALNVAALQLTGAAGKTFTNNGYVYVGGASNFPASFGTNTMSATSTVTYNGTTQTVHAGINYGNLTFTGSGLKTFGTPSGSVTGIANAFTNTNTVPYNGYAVDAQSNNATITYNGSVQQNIADIIYWDLVLNNTSAAKMNVNNNQSGIATVQDKVTFTAGILNTRGQGAANAFFVYGGNTTGTSTTSYVDGYVTGYASTDMNLPTGDAAATVGSVYQSIDPSPDNGNGFNAAYDAHTGTNTAIVNGGYTGVVAVDPYAFWYGTTTSTFPFRINLTPRDQSVAFGSGANVCVVGHNKSTNMWTALNSNSNFSTTYPGNQHAYFADIPDASIYDAYTMGSDMSAILPVALTTVTATVTANCGATIKWATATESNSKQYLVENSTDGTTFATAGTVASSNKATGAAYTYTYANLAYGANYFRIKAVDFDGKSMYSSIVSVNGNCTLAPAITAWPNPAQAYINIYNLSGKTSILVFNAAGQEMTSVTASGISQRIDVASFAKGSYVVRVLAQDGTATTLKFIKN